MAGKSKAKSKGAPTSSAASAKDQKSIEKVRDITKRLRKKLDFSDLNKEISAHVAGNPSAVSLLCKAKVDLTHAVDELLRAKVLEDDHGFRVSLPDVQAERLFSAVENARQGAEQYQSLLCARFYYRLLGVLRPGFEKLHLLEEVDAANDPATELVEQVDLSLLCTQSVSALCSVHSKDSWSQSAEWPILCCSHRFCATSKSWKSCRRSRVTSRR